MPTDSPYTLTVVAVLCVLYVAGGFVKGAASFGQPMVTVSLGALLLPVPSAIAVATIPAFASNIFQAWTSRQAVGELKTYRLFYLLLALGLVAGLNVFAALDQDTLQAVIGVFLAVFAVTQIAGFHPPLKPPPHQSVLALTGLVSGLAAGTTSFVGFPSLPVLIAYRVERAAFALITSVMFFITMSLISGGLFLLGLFGRGELLVGILCCLPSLLGQQIGVRLRNRLSVARLRLVINVVLAAVGISLVLRALEAGLV
ncbi:TSUP family transporter [Amorphus sp. 3PC139-8]|uniref:TSUP family transporter n=1 Tax=Amorphus sp. 3PC139-8 TaxID=2735676 RepID=UPI00345DFE89